MILWPEEDSQCNVHVLQVWCRMWRHGRVKGEKREEGGGRGRKGERRNRGRKGEERKRGGKGEGERERERGRKKGKRE